MYQKANLFKITFHQYDSMIINEVSFNLISVFVFRVLPRHTKMEGMEFENREYMMQKLKWVIQNDNELMSENDCNIIKDIACQDEIVDILFDTIKYQRPDVLSAILPGVKEEIKHVLRCGKSVLDKLLCVSVENGFLELVRVLVKSGSKPNETFYGKPLLHIAATRGDVDVCRELLAAGAKIDATDKRGDSVLHNVLTSQLSDCVSIYFLQLLYY